MQNNPTSNGQGAGGITNLTAGSATQSAAQAAKSEPSLSSGGGMFGAGSATVTETLGGKRADGQAAPRKAMQLGKAKKLPNNLNLI